MPAIPFQQHGRGLAEEYQRSDHFQHSEREQDLTITHDMIELDKIYNEDCLEGMKRIPDGSIDCIICDLPYGTTQLAWDKVIPFEPLWEQYKRITKENAAIILFSSQPFTTDLICSNREMFRYEIIWDKVTKTNFYDAKKRPMKSHENILVFYRKQPTYNPQKDFDASKARRKPRANSDFFRTSGGFVAGVSEEKAKEYRYVDDGTTYPGTIITVSNWNGVLFGKAKGHIHPKPEIECQHAL